MSNSVYLHVLIDGKVFALPRHYVSPEAIDDEALEILDWLRSEAIFDSMKTWFRRNPDAGQDEIEAEVEARCKSFTLLPSQDFDLVQIEAQTMAAEMINAELAKAGLPPPRDITEHARALVAERPDLLERARNRIELRVETGRKALTDLEARAGL